jgi:hypothetical protein
MLPITYSDKETRSKFQRFLFKGFADKEELKAAIFANNPDMTDEQRADVEYDLSLLDSIVDTRSTRTIVGGMVQVVDVNDYAYMGKWGFNQNRLFAVSVNEADLITNEEMPEEIAISTVTVDE